MRISVLKGMIGLGALLWIGTDLGRAAVSLQLDIMKANQCRVREVMPGEYEIKTTGTDPFLYFKPVGKSEPLKSNHVLAFEYFCPDGLGGLSVYYGPPISEDQSLGAGDLARAESWMPHGVDLKERSLGRWTPDQRQLRLDLGRRSGVTLRMRRFQLRPPSAEEQTRVETVERLRRDKRAKAATVREYLHGFFPVTFERVKVSGSSIAIRGMVSGVEPSSLRLVQVPYHDDLAKPLEPESVTSLTLEGEEFEVVLPRFEDGRDRMVSRWCVARQSAGGKLERISAIVYATDLSQAGPVLQPVEMPRSRKGLGGVGWRPILPELMELGVRHATVNIPLNSLFSLTPAPGKLRFDHEGLVLYVHESGLAHYDRLIHFLSTNQIVVSAVILVPFGGEAAVVERLLHPEANRAGHYAMPNFTSPQGAKLYGAMLAFLAERYAQAGDPHGRITNWIMHNEIDYGWEWTNMGAQPREIYLDSYVRSMRLAYYTARRFNPQARVFISLTHSWNVAPDPAWKTYAPRRLLEDLGRYSRLEGDFEWGVAYHPYPQSLFKPDTWNDQLATHSMDTRMITMKNIEVLDAFMKREDMLYQASKVRGILLSEQGFHTPGYSERAERLQAAALVYTWQQMRKLDSIEAFHNHRWVDHPQEGGLLLGLRRLPSTEFPQGQKKFAWEIYQALETDREEAMTRFARELINAE